MTTGTVQKVIADRGFGVIVAEEPGCAIKAAVQDGRFDARRYSLLLKLHEEMRVNAPASWRR